MALETVLADRTNRAYATTLVTNGQGNEIDIDKKQIFLVGFLLLIAAFGLFELELKLGTSLEQARTVAVNVFVMAKLFYLFNCRSLTKSIFSMRFFSNKWLIYGSLLMIVLQILFTYLPIMNLLFVSAPINVDSWIRIVEASFIIFSIVALKKHIRQKQFSNSIITS